MSLTSQYSLDRPPYFRYSAATDTFFAGVGRSFRLDPSGNFAGPDAEGLYDYQQVDEDSVLLELDTAQKRMTKNDWTALKENKPRSVSLMTKALSDSANHKKTLELTHELPLSAGGTPLSLIMGNESRPAGSGPRTTQSYKPVTAVVPDVTVVFKNPDNHTKGIKRIEVTMDGTVVDTETGNHAALGSEAFRVIAGDLGHTLLQVMRGQLASLISPSCLPSQLDSVQNSIAAVSGAHIDRHIRWDVKELDIDNSRLGLSKGWMTKPISAKVTESVGPFSVVVKAKFDEWPL